MENSSGKQMGAGASTVSKNISFAVEFDIKAMLGYILTNEPGKLVIGRA